MKKKGPINDPWGTLCFSVPQLEKIFEFYYKIVLEVCLLLVKQGLNQSAVLESCTNVIIWKKTHLQYIK